MLDFLGVHSVTLCPFNVTIYLTSALLNYAIFMKTPKNTYFRFVCIHEECPLLAAYISKIRNTKTYITIDDSHKHLLKLNNKIRFRCFGYKQN